MEMGVLDGGLRAQIIQVAAAPVAVDTSGIGNWLRDNAVKVILIVIGLVILMASRRGDHSRVVSVLGLSLIGLMVLGIAFSGSALDVGYWLARLFIPDLQTPGTPPSGVTPTTGG
jgi:membrane-bound ClpP family serine protease